MNRERFLKVARQWDWANIDDIFQRALDDGRIFDHQDYVRAFERAAKAELRKVMRDAKDENGEPIFASIERMTEEGEKERIYKQETLFNPDDYKQTVKYFGGLSRKAWKEMQRYRDNCHKRYGIQIPLPWFPEEESATA
jgi:hypothetical protein